MADGWFVVNVRDAQWLTPEGGELQPSGSVCTFETDDAPFSEPERPTYWNRLPWA